MGEAELQIQDKLLIIHCYIIIYGDAASDTMALQIAKDIEDYWNEPMGTVNISDGWFTKKECRVIFKVDGNFEKDMKPETIFNNSNPRNNYFRIEEYANGNISYVDGINSNTGYFKLQNLLDNSSTAAHEFGHTIGLDHPQNRDIRGQGAPGIMYPRGTIVDPQFQYYPDVAPGEKGGTLNPFTRKVLQKDIDDLKLNNLNFDVKGFAILGGFSSVWHDKHIPQ